MILGCRPVPLCLQRRHCVSLAVCILVRTWLRHQLVTHQRNHRSYSDYAGLLSALRQPPEPQPCKASKQSKSQRTAGCCTEVAATKCLQNLRCPTVPTPPPATTTSSESRMDYWTVPAANDRFRSRKGPVSPHTSVRAPMRLSR